MIKIVEEIKPVDYKQDILEHISKIEKMIDFVEKSIKKSSAVNDLDEITAKIHNVYDDIIDLIVAVSTTNQ